MSIFSAKYRPLAKEGFRCVFRTITFKPCDTGLDDRIKAEVVSGALRVHPTLARVTNQHFTTLSWIFVILTFASFVLTAQAAWNLVTVGTCDPANPEGCFVNQLKSDYGPLGGLGGWIDGLLNPPKPPISLDGIHSGNPNASVVIVEFGCFTCPYTGKAAPAVEQMIAEFNDSIYYVFKPFPIPGHAYSNESAVAVLCSRNQGKEWEFQREIFKNQDTCTADGKLALRHLANASGLEMNRFNECFDTNATMAELAGYIAEGKESHIQSTPTFFINGKTYVGPMTIEQFRTAINEARAKAG